MPTLRDRHKRIRETRQYIAKKKYTVDDTEGKTYRTKDTDAEREKFEF